MNESRATVKGDEVFPEDIEAAEVGLGNSGNSTNGDGGAVGVGNSEVGSDLSPGGGVDAGHGHVGGVVEVVLKGSSGGLVGEGGDELKTA